MSVWTSLETSNCGCWDAFCFNNVEEIVRGHEFISLEERCARLIKHDNVGVKVLLFQICEISLLGSGIRIIVLSLNGVTFDLICKRWNYIFFLGGIRYISFENRHHRGISWINQSIKSFINGVAFIKNDLPPFRMYV